MPTPTTTPSAPGPTPELQERRAEIESHEHRNLIVLAVYQVVLRIGWIFKTESVIMPAFMDAIAGPGWLRGFLPVLNRAGQSVPPMLFADRLRRFPLKKRSLITTSIAMAVPFLLLAGIWASLEEKRQWWLPPLFLLLYFVFFSMNGLNQLGFNTIQGKLISPQRRGRLMGVGGVLGAVGAVVAALLLLRPWMGRPNNSGFSLVFLFNGAAFAAAGLIALGCAEPADESDGGHLISVRQTFRAAWDVYTHDREFRRASRVAILFMSALLLFPHYQWLGREHLGTSNQDLITWVVAQNISVGVISPLLGMIADRRGNRLAVRLGVFVSALTPLLAIFLASSYVAEGGRWYWLTFVLLGLCPVTMRMLQNYTLELVDEEQHPRYLSTMTVCFAVPFVLAPLFGWLIDLLPYQYPFAAVSVMIAAGGLMTFRMSEPRHRRKTST